MNYPSEKEEIVYFMQRLYDKNLTTCSGGNISILLDNGNVLITPSQIDKGRLRPDLIGEITQSGEILTTDIKLSMETNMHLSIYRKNPNYKAIIHAHPPNASTFSAISRKINTHLTGEAWAILGEPAYVDYHMMGTEKLAQSVAKASLESAVMIMKNHGITTLGHNLTDAYNRMEVLEAAAYMTIQAALLGNCRVIPQDSLKKITDYFSGSK